MSGQPGLCRILKTADNKGIGNSFSSRWSKARAEISREMPFGFFLSFQFQMQSTVELRLQRKAA